MAEILIFGALLLTMCGDGLQSIPVEAVVVSANVRYVEL